MHLSDGRFASHEPIGWPEKADYRAGEQTLRRVV
jgi:hypothetical protein